MYLLVQLSQSDHELLGWSRSCIHLCVHFIHLLGSYGPSRHTPGTQHLPSHLLIGNQRQPQFYAHWRKGEILTLKQ